MYVTYSRELLLQPTRHLHGVWNLHEAMMKKNNENQEHHTSEQVFTIVMLIKVVMDSHFPSSQV